MGQNTGLCTKKLKNNFGQAKPKCLTEKYAEIERMCITDKVDICIKK